MRPAIWESYLMLLMLVVDCSFLPHTRALGSHMTPTVSILKIPRPKAFNQHHLCLLTRTVMPKPRAEPPPKRPRVSARAEKAAEKAAAKAAAKASTKAKSKAKA